MPWTRLDDSYDTHPKILALGTDARRWTWTRIIIYTTRHKTPRIPPGITEAIPKATPKFIQECFELGLVDADSNGELTVHDWHLYQAKDIGAAHRMERFRESMPQVDRALWKKTRDRVLVRDQGICADCGKDCLNAPSDDGRWRWNADHTPPRDVLIARGDSIYDLQYITTRCHSCHAKKTRTEAKNRE